MTEPDYRSVEKLHAAPVATPQFPHDAIVIGVGPVGRAVTERLAEELPDRPERLLLSVGIAGMEHDSGLLLPQPDSHLKDSEKLTLRGGYSSSESDRSDCRSTLLIDLGYTDPAIWTAFQQMAAKLPSGTQGGIWLVASLFDVVGSGLIFDLAYLAKLVSENQNKTPSVNWLVTLPTSEWGDEHLAAAGAVLREVQRLMDGASPERPYEYAPHSNNTALREQWVTGKSSISRLFLCYPSQDSFGQEAGREVIEQMVILLKPLLQPNGWSTIRDSLGNSKQDSDPCCTLFAGKTHTIPLQLLQEWVRTQLAAKVLTNEGGGIFPGRFRRTTIDESAALTLLEYSKDNFLKQVANDQRSRSRTRQWPPAQNAKTKLIEAVRNQLEERGRSESPAQLILVAKSLIATLQSILSRASAEQEVLAGLQNVLKEAAKEIETWQKWGEQVTEESERRLSQIRRKWQQSVPPGWRRLIDDRALEEILGKFTTEEFNSSWQQYIRWAWLSSGPLLQIRLDTLFPDYEKKYGWRHLADGDVPSLWNGVNGVMAALTGENYWPTSVHSQDGTKLTEVVKDLEGLTGRYGSISTGRGMISRQGFQISGNVAWRNRMAFPDGVAIHRIDNKTTVEGSLLLLHTGVPIDSLALRETVMKPYWQRRSPELHLFEPEKRAVAIEQAALATLSRRERRELPGSQLSSPVVGLLQWEDLVKAFVWAWRLGWVTPALRAGVYRLTLPDAPESSWNWVAEKPCNHIVEAMQAFVLSKKDMSDQNKLARQVQQALKPESEARNEVEGIHSKSEKWEVDWWFLVRGIKDS